MTDASEQQEARIEKRWGCLGWMWRGAVVGLILLAGLLVWVNGPGMRWLGPKIGKHYLTKAGITGDFSLGGTLLGGIDIHGVELTSGGAMERVVVDRLETDYRFSEIIKGRLRGISGEGVHVDLRLVEKEKEERPPPDFARIGKMLRQLRGKIIPLGIDLREVSFSVKQDGKRVVEVEKSNLFHQAGDAAVELELGSVIGPNGKRLEPQQVEILWSQTGLALNRLDLLPILGLSDVVVELPESGAVTAAADIRVDDAVLRLDVAAGIKDVRVDLVEGAVDIAKVMDGLGLEMPVVGRITSLAADVSQVFPEWNTGVGTMDILLEDFAWADWQVPEVAAALRLDEGEFGAKFTGRSQNSGFSIDGGGEFERSKLATEGFSVNRIGGTLQIDHFEKVLNSLDDKFEWGIDVRKFPASEVSGDWVVKLGPEGFGGVEADLNLKAKEAAASPVSLKVFYEKNLVTIENFSAEGIKFTGKYDLDRKSYEGVELLENFDSARIAPWMKGLGLESPGTGVFSLRWEGSGSLADHTHRGNLSSFSGDWKWNEVAGEDTKQPISASGEAVYDWPKIAEVKGLVIETQGQKINIDALLKDHAIELGKFVWSEGEMELAEGSGKLPVPEDFSKFKEFIADDNRPLDLKVESRTLPLAILKPWIGGLDKISEKATGKLNLTLAGSLAEPRLEALVEIKDVSSPTRKELPESDLKFEIKARDGIAEIHAEAVARDYAPAVLEAEMAFLPKKWATDPASLKMEKVSARLELPRLDLSRFTELVPGIRELGGVTTGSIVVSGTVGEPVIDGNLKLSGGRIRMGKNTLPDLEGINLDLKADFKTVKLTGSVTDVAGGTLQLNGNMNLKNAAGDGFGEVSMSVKGRALPILRNDFLLMRANADLSIRGTVQNALLTGTVGIIDSVFYKDMELIPIGAPFLEPKAASLPKVDVRKNFAIAVPPLFSEWPMDVVVKTEDPILIRGNLGKGRIDAALRIEGKLGDPRPNGKARISEAVARLPFSTLEVREGFLTFTPQTGFDPILEIRGNAEPRPYRVEVYVYGRASDPKVVLTSEPPLPENEIMTLLATGTTTAGLEDSQAASSRAMQLLIEELRRGRFLFGKQLRPILGLLDNVDFSLAETDPYDADSYTSATLKLNDKWSVSAGLGSEGDQRVLAMWRLRFK
ncbi:MAG: translocation/assembly module TamB domain-containing protein [Armatimonadetes bacterium]|nr:translocation/assembly module TamB domain-containing protein [Akkermansiaceae bacterium]